MTIINQQQFIVSTASLRGLWRTNEPLAPYTSWRAGGRAKYYYRPADLADLTEFLRLLPATEELFWLGLGSNVLIRDGGFSGVVIHLHKCLSDLALTPAGDILRIGSGVTCAKIARFCAKANLLGGEFFAGIPGTMGGALAMNAGAFGNETWQHVVAVEVIDRTGKVSVLPAAKFKVSYRSVERDTDCWFVAGHLRFSAGNGALAQQQVKELLKKRNTSQPIGQLSCGSVFKNPPGNYAAKLIEACNLKGMRQGNAQVSSKHANFIINAGDATAQDIEALIALVQSKVFAEHGIQLETEVKIVGG